MTEYRNLEIRYEPLLLTWMDNSGAHYLISAKDGALKPHKDMKPWAKTLFRACLLKILEELDEDQ